MGCSLRRPRPITSGHVTHFRLKGHTRADTAQLPVAHAQNILPDTIHRKYDLSCTHILLLLECASAWNNIKTKKTNQAAN
jgi:hypothetical protein